MLGEGPLTCFIGDLLSDSDLSADCLDLKNPDLTNLDLTNLDLSRQDSSYQAWYSGLELSLGEPCQGLYSGCLYLSCSDS